MKITAKITNGESQHKATVATNGTAKTIAIPPKESGPGSSVNGGELLCLALATCYCNDIYREAAKLGINVKGVEVDVDAEFGAEGEAARDISYSVHLEADASEDEIRKLIAHTDGVSEIHNTLRRSVAVELRS